MTGPLCFVLRGYRFTQKIQHSYGEHPLNINSPEAPHFNRWIALEFITAVGTNLDAVFPLVGPSLNLTPDQCHLSFFLKLKTHICLKEVFYSYFMRIWNNQQWKTKKPSFIPFNLFGSISTINTFFFVFIVSCCCFPFFRGGEGGRGCGTFSSTIKIIKPHTAICTSLRFDSW